MADKTAVVLVADGSEEMEAVITINVLRRAGVTVTVAGLNGKSTVQCSRGVVIQPDTSVEDAVTKGPYNAVILPGGGPGAQALAQNTVVGQLLKDQEKSGGVIAAICASPAVGLVAHGIGTSKKVTCYPAMKDKIPLDKYTVQDDKVVIDGQLITSQGPGTTFDFALAIVDKLCGAEKAQATKTPLLL